MSGPGMAAAGMPELHTSDGCEETRRAWAYLSRVAGGPCAPLEELVAAVGVLEAARAVRDWDLPPALRAPTEARRHVDSAAADLALMRRMGGRLVTPGDAEWPAWRMLAYSGRSIAAAAKSAGPLALWVWGDLRLNEMPAHAAAIVGARAASRYGERVATEIAGELSRQGWLIVSGAAYGIDAAAHRAALAAGAATVAVLACGPDIAYPASHDRLLREIARHGAVISEYAPGTSPAKYRFLARNRLVAGLSDGVVVVEAGRRSGARNTAAWARRLGRPALAVPGPVDSATSAGSHQLIRNGEAILVTTAEEVIAEVGPITPGPVAGGQDRETDMLSGDQLLVYEALAARRGRSAAEVVVESGVSLPGVRAALPALELLGFAESAADGWRLARRPGPLDQARPGTRKPGGQHA